MVRLTKVREFYRHFATKRAFFGEISINSVNPTLAFQALDPDRILDAIDAAGWRTDGRVTALNSYENRVYQIGLEDGSSIVAKFYRPERWSDEAIAEEHSFCQELVAADLPVIAPLSDTEKRTLIHVEPFRLCVFPKAGGRPPELDNSEQLTVIGRTLGRLHAVGETKPFSHRPAVNVTRLGQESVAHVLESNEVPLELIKAYESIVHPLLDDVQARFDDAKSVKQIRIHGDFHPGNILWGQDETPHLLDFDDTAMGPSVQDLWLFISGDHQYAQARLGDLLDGYFEFREFDERELSLIEPLRSLRIVHYAAWISKRWQDPAFQQAFPFFAGNRFWDEHILALKEQRARLDEPLLRYN